MENFLNKTKGEKRSKQLIISISMKEVNSLMKGSHFIWFGIFHRLLVYLAKSKKNYFFARDKADPI